MLVAVWRLRRGRIMEWKASGVWCPFFKHGLLSWFYGCKYQAALENAQLPTQGQLRDRFGRALFIRKFARTLAANAQITKSCR
jgi:hypothetical protein